MRYFGSPRSWPTPFTWHGPCTLLLSSHSAAERRRQPAPWPRRSWKNWRNATPAETPLSPTMLDVSVHNLLSIKIFHGVLAGNVHEYSLKSPIGKVGRDLDHESTSAS